MALADIKQRPGLVLGVAVVIIASAVPLYGRVRQEYIPTNVDEAEFQVGVTAPEGTSFEAMRRIMTEIDRDLRETPGVRLVLSTAGSGFLGGVNNGRAYVRIAPHEERIFSLGRLWRATLAGDLAELERHYKTEFSGTRASWSLRLVPREARVQRAVDSITLGGAGARLTKVDTLEANGDRSVMTIQHDG